MKTIERKERKNTLKTPFPNVVLMSLFLFHTRYDVAPISYNEIIIEIKWQWWENSRSVVMGFERFRSEDSEVEPKMSANGSFYIQSVREWA